MDEFITKEELRKAVFVEKHYSSLRDQNMRPEYALRRAQVFAERDIEIERCREYVAQQLERARKDQEKGVQEPLNGYTTGVNPGGTLVGTGTFPLPAGPVSVSYDVTNNPVYRFTYTSIATENGECDARTSDNTEGTEES